MPQSSPGRSNQRQRTRDEIVAATIVLLKAGAAPSVADIAAAARVSRRTVYLHFPSLDQLLTDARVGLLSQQAVESVIDLTDPGGDLETRVTVMIDAVIENAWQTLPLGRSLIRLTVETPGEPGVPKRGYRRVAWIEKALAPLQAELSPPQFQHLVSALAIVIGWEALIVLADVRGLDLAAQRETIHWSARAILRAALEKPRRGKGKAGSRRT